MPIIQMKSSSKEADKSIFNFFTCVCPLPINGLFGLYWLRHSRCHISTHTLLEFRLTHQRLTFLIMRHYTWHWKFSAPIVCTFYSLTTHYQTRARAIIGSVMKVVLLLSFFFLSSSSSSSRSKALSVWPILAMHKTVHTYYTS